MRILVSANCCWTVWQYRSGLMQALIMQGHEVTVIAPLDRTSEKLEAVGCRVIPLNMNPKGLNPFAEAKLIFEIWKLLKKSKFDICLSFTVKNNIYTSLASSFLNIPCIPNVTGLGTSFLSGKILAALAKFLYRVSFVKCPKVFFQNQDDAALFRTLGLVRDNQIEILPGSGIDLIEFAKTNYESGDRIRFLMISRLLKDKGTLEYFEAANQIKALRKDVVFGFLGSIDANNRSAIKAQTLHALVDSGVIEYLGVTEDVRPFIASADCVVLPSYREGAPRSLMEAASMARPVIATDVPGCRAVVDHGKTGLLCAAKSSESLKTAMTTFLDMPFETRRKMALAGREKMEREFSEERVIMFYLRAISAALAAT